MSEGAQTSPGEISVIMVSYLTGPALMESIRAVQRDPDIAELIVVDNGNTRAERIRLVEVASRRGNVRILQGHGNVGFARGCNYGARLAQGDYLLFLNPDALIEAGAARQMAYAGRTADRPWIAGGRLVNSDGGEQRGPRRGELTFASAFASFTPLHRLPGVRSIHRDGDPMPDGPMPMPTISGACLMTDRASFAQLGGFDEGYFLHVEDIDICARARRMGGSVTFVPGAVAMHYGSTSNVTRWRVEWHKYRGFLRYFWRRSPGLGSKVATVISAPLMGAALMGRATWLTVRKAFLGS